MEKFQRYYGIIIFMVAAVLLLMMSYSLVTPKIEKLTKISSTIKKKEGLFTKRQQELKVVKTKIKKIKDSISGSHKKIYSPIESDIGNDTLFFTLYNDVLEMVHANSIKIKALDYVYNPNTDAFVEFGKDVYFVCDINMELVSNYVDLGKLLQDVYQYPYYIKINELNVKPYSKDKKILLSNLSLRLYARTTVQES